jgi:arabinose operon protein AraL
MYRAYLFDLDGTIYVGDTLLSGAAETIAVLRKADWRTIFLSINPTKTRSQYATKLTRMGLSTRTFGFLWQCPDTPTTTFSIGRDCG